MLGFRFRSTSGFAGTAPRLAQGRPFRTPFSVATGRADPPGEAVVTVFVVDSGPPSAKRQAPSARRASVASARSASAWSCAPRGLQRSLPTPWPRFVRAPARQTSIKTLSTAAIGHPSSSVSWWFPFTRDQALGQNELLTGDPSAGRAVHPGVARGEPADASARTAACRRRLPPAACCLLPAASTRSGGTVAPDRRRRAAGTGRLPAWLSLAAPRTPGRWWCRGRTACRRRRRCGPRRWPAGGRCAPLGRWRAAGRWRCWPHARCSR